MKTIQITGTTRAPQNPEEQKGAEAARKGLLTEVAIRCDALSCRFDKVLAVEDLSFEVYAGERFALLGPNGAGKTTALHMLITMLKPTSGSASVLGFDVSKEAHAVRSEIGVVFQEPALDDRLTARENLAIHASLYALPRKGRKAQIERALEWGSLTEVANRLVRTFSGGMKRRLELSRALMHGPKLLFFGRTDPRARPAGAAAPLERIAALSTEGLTTFMTTHYLQEAEACDRVGIVDKGKLIALGTPAELKTKVVGSAEGTLEDVFLELTGRELRDESASPRARMLNFARKGGEHTK